MKLIDNAIAKAVGMLNFIGFILASLTIIDWMDFSIRIVTGIISAVIGWLVIRHYRLKIRLTEKELELKDQELFKLIQENKSRGI